MPATDPTLCMIFESIGTHSAIAKIAMTDVQIALESGFNVTVVAKHLDESLRGRVNWLRLAVPRRVFLLKWLTARTMIKRALGGRTFDIIHAHQPQAASLSDVFQCHYLTRAAYELNCLEGRPGLRPALIRWQEHAVLRAEDHFYKNWNPSTQMLFVSPLVRDQFARLYGLPPKSDVLVNPFPPLQFPTDTQRQAARARLVGNHAGPVVGYLGGLQERKGYHRLIDALKSENDIFLLFAGSYSENFTVPDMTGRFRSLGLVSDTAEFYAACDVLVVPSLYEPLGMVAFESVAHGTPVIATPAVGALPHLLDSRAGAAWNPTEPLAPIVRSVSSSKEEYRAGALRMSNSIGTNSYKTRLLNVYEQVLRSKTRPATASFAPSRPTLCMIFEAIGTYSAIAKIAMADVQIALDAGYDLTVIAKHLDESLRDKVQWLKLTVPSRLFLLQWLTARSFIKNALGNRSFDIIHAHQPQVASLSDVFQCHFLTRVAYETKCLESRQGLRPLAVRAQQQGVLYAEDRCYKNWNSSTRMLYNSSVTRDDFHRLYGPVPKEEVLVYPFPPLNLASPDERATARRDLVGDFSGLVVGYIGGIQKRKGYQRVIDALAHEPDMFLLMGGPYSENFQTPALNGRFRSLGLVQDTDRFYAAIDVLVVPSVYEALGLVAFEAVSRGIPVITTPQVGAAPHLVRYNTGAIWQDHQPLPPLVRSLASRPREDFSIDARRMHDDLCQRRYGQRLLEIYNQILSTKKSCSPSITPIPAA